MESTSMDHDFLAAQRKGKIFIRLGTVTIIIAIVLGLSVRVYRMLGYTDLLGYIIGLFYIIIPSAIIATVLLIIGARQTKRAKKLALSKADEAVASGNESIANAWIQQAKEVKSKRVSWLVGSGITLSVMAGVAIIVAMILLRLHLILSALGD